MATTYPAMSAITSAWSTVSEYGLYLAIVSFHIQVSTLFRTQEKGFGTTSPCTFSVPFCENVPSIIKYF